MKYLLFIALSFSLSACKNNPSGSKSTAPAEEKYDAIATGLCACWKPFADFKERADALIAAQNTEELTKLSESFEMIENDVDDCLEKVSDQHGDVEEENEKIKLHAALTKICPKIAALIKEAEAELEEF